MLNDVDGLDAQGTVRRANLRRALQLVFDSPGTQTRAGIARATGLTAATASSLVAELIRDRLVAEGAPAASTGGKRATTLSIDGGHHLLLALVVRRTDAVAALVRLDGTTQAERRIAYTPQERDRALAALVADVAAGFGGRILAASVQLPGATDGRIVLESVQLEWRDEPLAERLEAALSAPVVLVNDVDAEAIAEAGTEPDPLGYRLFLHIGVGIGAALTLDGEIAPGPHARGGEIGHVRVVFEEDAQPCRCGLRGCLESAASMVAMLGDGFAEGMDDAAAQELLAGADPRLLDAGATALARAIKLVAAMLDPAEVVIGGGAELLGTGFLDAVRHQIAYAASGTSSVPVRYARAQRTPWAGAAQIALSAALGVRWAARDSVSDDATASDDVPASDTETASDDAPASDGETPAPRARRTEAPQLSKPRRP